ncbi:MAG: hypothetical protein NZU63_05030 [Gemmataceae bacterium]|nr:hypothetical protein [Gemmataceae bacterium]MDW8242427.1 hypothetical protein [Thermogemmata sp.]
MASCLAIRPANPTDQLRADHLFDQVYPCPIRPADGGDFGYDGGFRSGLRVSDESHVLICGSVVH